MVGSQSYDPSSSSSTSQLDMMNQMMSSVMAKVEESLKKQKEDFTTLVSQMLNNKAEQDAKKGGLPSNVVVNPQNMHSMQLRSGRQYGDAYEYEEEEEETQLPCEAELNPPIDGLLDEAESLPMIEIAEQMGKI